MNMDPEETLDQALQLGDEGRWPEMADLLETALRDDPDDEYLLAWLGVAQHELGNDGVAYEYFRRAWEQEPLDPNILAMCGTGLALFDDPDAEAALRAAVLTGPDVLSARLQYGSYLAREGLFDNALEQLNAALALEPDDPVVHGELGTTYALKGDMRQAASEMERSLDLSPDDHWTRTLLGLVYVELGEMESAAEVLLRAAGEMPEDGELQLLAALAAAATGWEGAAQDALARADYVPEPIDAELLAEVTERIDEGEEASREFLRETFAPGALHDRLIQPI